MEPGIDLHEKAQRALKAIYELGRYPAESIIEGPLALETI